MELAEIFEPAVAGKENLVAKPLPRPQLCYGKTRYPICCSYIS